MRDFRELKVWVKAHALVLGIYRVTGNFPRQELYGLTSQLRHAAASIEANVAEGSGKNTRPDFARFLQIALSSAREVEYELLLSHDLGYLSADECADLLNQVSEVKKMLTGFIKYLNDRQSAA